MRIVQVLTSLTFGDAIGNDVLAIDKALRQMGYATEIYAEKIDRRLPAGTALPVSRLDYLGEDDLIFYHLSTGTMLNYQVAESRAKLLVYYHNITPPDYFHGYSSLAEQNCRDGLKAAKFLADKADFCFAVSEFNRQDLIRMGFRQDIRLLPILVPFSDYQKTPNREVIRRYSGDGKVNILFTGRVAPNKKHEDILQAFSYYKKYKNPNSRLILVGGFDERDRYYQRLKQYIELLQIPDVIFPGHIGFDEILAYYHLADVFLCMSEHEGFCVPVLEAMYFQIPIIAYASSAVPDTIGSGGLLLDEKDPAFTAEAIDRVVTDKALAAYLRSEQKKRLHQFSYEAIYRTLQNYMLEIVGEPE